MRSSQRGMPFYSNSYRSPHTLIRYRFIILSHASDLIDDQLWVTKDLHVTYSDSYRQLIKASYSAMLFVTRKSNHNAYEMTKPFGPSKIAHAPFWISRATLSICRVQWYIWLSSSSPSAWPLFLCTFRFSSLRPFSSLNEHLAIKSANTWAFIIVLGLYFK